MLATGDGLPPKGPLTLGKDFVEGGPRQRAFGEFWVGEEGLCRGSLIGHSAKPLPRAGPALGKEKQPSRRRRLGRSLCRGPSPGALGKELFFFFWKIFAEGLQPWPSAKKCCRIFPKNLCRGQWDGPRQRIILFFWKNLCWGLPRRPSAKKF